MRKQIAWRRLLILLTAILLMMPAAVQAKSPRKDIRKEVIQNQMAEELAAAVNALRSEYGVEQISIHPILMQVAQTHAEYMASTGQVTHYSADGKRPFQRALDAGYPVGGDLSLGGFYSENITAGANMTPQQAVQSWMGDEPHRNTMLSEWRTHLGVGIAYSGGVAYYVLDTALYSSQPVNQTFVVDDLPTQGTQTAPIWVSTPQADGSILHTVQIGQTLWAIAAVYGITVEQLVQLNALQSDQYIFPGDTLLVQQGMTATPTDNPSPSMPATRRASATQTQTPALASQQAEQISLIEPTGTSIFPSPIQQDPMDVIVPAAVVIAFLILVVILWHGFRRGTDS